MSKIDCEDKDHIYKDGFEAWMVSGRERPDVGYFERVGIRMKTKVVRGVREFCRGVKAFRENVEKLVEREILTPRILGGLKMDLSRFEGSLLVGDADDVDDGMSARVTFRTVERASNEFALMKLPRGVGTAIVIDLLLRTDAEPEDVKNCVKSISSVFSEHLDSDLSKLPLFHSWKVFAYKSDVDNVDVIR